jgi:hypothetical protein
VPRRPRRRPGGRARWAPPAAGSRALSSFRCPGPQLHPRPAMACSPGAAPEPHSYGHPRTVAHVPEKSRLSWCSTCPWMPHGRLVHDRQALPQAARMPGPLLWHQLPTSALTPDFESALSPLFSPHTPRPSLPLPWTS